MYLHSKEDEQVSWLKGGQTDAVALAKGYIALAGNTFLD